MYFDRLSGIQREELLVYCHHMALVDHEFAPEEKHFLAELEREAGLNLHPARTIANTELAHFDTKASRVIAAMTILLVALVDCHLHVEESKFMGKLAGQMGFEQEEFNRLVQWAHEYDKAFRADDEAACTWLRSQGETLIDNT